MSTPAFELTSDQLMRRIVPIETILHSRRAERDRDPIAGIAFHGARMALLHISVDLRSNGRHDLYDDLEPLRDAYWTGATWPAMQFQTLKSMRDVFMKLSSESSYESRLSILALKGRCYAILQHQQPPLPRDYSEKKTLMLKSEIDTWLKNRAPLSAESTLEEEFSPELIAVSLGRLAELARGHRLVCSDYAP